MAREGRRPAFPATGQLSRWFVWAVWFAKVFRPIEISNSQTAMGHARVITHVAQESQQEYMKYMSTRLISALIISLSLASCTSGPSAQRGTAIGALGGAAAGGIIGKSVGGAAVGAGIGALGGNIIGGARDERRGAK